VRRPIAFVYGNCVFAEGLQDAWAVFRVDLASYAWLDDSAKRARFLALVGALEGIEADLQILRVAGHWQSGPDAPELQDTQVDPTAPCGRAGERRNDYLATQIRHLSELHSVRPSLFLAVSLRAPAGDVASFLAAVLEGRPGLLSSLRGLTGRGRDSIGSAALERVRVRADRVHAILEDFLSVRPARGVELQWLVRRAFCRGLGEPEVDGLHEPAALVFERNGQARLAPLEVDVGRWSQGEIEHRARCLKVTSELGTSWQGQLVLGALPEQVEFPGSRAELMFAVPEALPFPVDISLTARFLPNGLALRLARRRIQDADQIMRAESSGEQGVTDLGYERTQQARDLVSYLQAPSRPPLLRATVAVAVGAPSEQDLEQRIESVRRAFGEVRLHRPVGEQLALFVQHLPAQRTRTAGFEDVLTTEQVAAMMPTATHEAGSESGFYLGHTLSGSRRPVLLDLREGSLHDGNATILSVGALGSGKTTLAQKLQYEAFLQGARVIDCDPKGDHRFHLLEDVAPHVEQVTLAPDPRLRGMLDPLRVAPAHLRQEMTVSFLCDLLPGRAEPRWETAVLAAVDRVIGGSARPTCGEVVAALMQGEEVDRQVGQALEVYARSGLTQLGFADPSSLPPAVGDNQVVYLPIRDLPAAPPGAGRSEQSQAERIGEQVVRLIAMFALQLMSSERSRLKVFSFDEGWRLLADPIGRMLLTSLQRMGRSELAVPIISTQLLSDALVGERESIENLIGATFVFGLRSHAEAARALQLLGLDGENRSLRERLLGFGAGRCLFRDHRGRIEEIQVELLEPALIEAFSTTPR
jgi:hypothetical protein